MEQRRAKLDLELLLEASLNAEDVERAQGDGAAAVAERDRRFMKLFADYQLQKTHLARALTDARAADRMRQDAEREAERLRGDIDRLQVRRRCVLHAMCGLASVLDGSGSWDALSVGLCGSCYTHHVAVHLSPDMHEHVPALQWLRQ